MQSIYLAIVLAPLAGALIAGFYGQTVGRSGAHSFTIGGVGIAFLLSLYVVFRHTAGGEPVFNENLYTWMQVGDIHFAIGFLVDRLTALMMAVVTGVSLAVHVYTIGYMREDPGYQRFFSYIALFTFAMLMLVMSNNFLQLFFGWEAVGLVSYLLIGFWYRRESAIQANLKAFLVNRVGDFGFLLGIAAIVVTTGSLDYATVFEQLPAIQDTAITIIGDHSWHLLTVIGVLLFIGAMGKSAQVPLHVWLPDSMEGPTPISALIHAATMVTAGIFMVARLSPLYELAEGALVFILIIGAITALFMGLLGLVQHDIKRVVAYSTLSQLGYMTVALGVSAYSAAIFHLVTHAFFKALLFLAAGSVIIALHHQQDMRRMGGLWRYMPITYATALIGALALIGLPGLAGFFSKDAIIEAVHYSNRAGAEWVYWMLLAGVFVTALYTFRMIFLVFHGSERMDEHTREHVHESPAVVTGPLIFLAVPSAVLGWLLIGPLLFGGYFGDSLFVAAGHDPLTKVAEYFHGSLSFALHGLKTPAFWLALLGVVTAWVLYIARPELPERIGRGLRPVHYVLEQRFGFDYLYMKAFPWAGRGLGGLAWRFGDRATIDGFLVNGSAFGIGWFAGIARFVQTGYLYHYAFAMIIGLVAFLTWIVFLR